MGNLATFLLLATLVVTLLNAGAIFFLWLDVRNTKDAITPPLFDGGQPKQADEAKEAKQPLENSVTWNGPPSANMWYGIDPPTWRTDETTTTTTLKLPDDYYEDVTVTMDGKAATMTAKKAAKTPTRTATKPTRKKAAKK